MKRPKIASEAVLAGAVAEWMRADGWRTFHEVELPHGGRADVVAARRGLVWIVETKLRAGLEVLDQALERRRAGAHGVLVAVPAGDAALMLAGIAARVGVGVIAVRQVEVFEGRFATVLRPEIKTWPEFTRKARTAELLRWCTPGHEVQAAGVTGAAARWTPFKAVVREVVRDLAAAEGHRMLVDQLALADAVRAYRPHHAAPQLRRWLCWAIDDGFVPGCSLVGRGKARMVVFDAAAVTSEQKRDLQLGDDVVPSPR